MKNGNIDIYVYIHSAKAERTAAITDMIEGVSGVVGASVNQFVKRLVNVSYNPREVSSTAIVNAARKEGEHVALVSM